MHTTVPAAEEDRTPRPLWESLIAGLLACTLYLLTVSPTAYPGESAALMVQAAGLDYAPPIAHPVWFWIAQKIAGLGLLSLPLRMNLLSVAAAFACATIFHRLAYRLLLAAIGGKFTAREAQRAARLGAGAGMLALALSVPFWSAATQLHYQAFDLLMLLVWAALLVRFVLGKGTAWPLYLAGLIYGVGIIESVDFIFLAPVAIALTAFALWQRAAFKTWRFFLIGLCTFAGTLLYIPQAKACIQAAIQAGLESQTLSATLVEIWKEQIRTMLDAVPRVGWIYLLLTAILPAIVTAFVANQGINGKKNWSQYTLHLTLTIIAFIALVNAPISPAAIYAPLGKLPVLLSAMVAATVAYLSVYWYLLRHMTQKTEARHGTKGRALAAGRWMGRLCLWPLLALVCLALPTNFFTARAARGAFADRFADEALSAMGTRTWFVADGLLDNHLLIRAKERGLPFNLLSLERGLAPNYATRLKQIIRQANLFPTPADANRMACTLDLGLLPFIQDWMAFDPNITTKLAISSIPDLWYAINLLPVPEGIFFGGAANLDGWKERDILAEALPFWDRMEGILSVGERKNDDTPVEALRKQLRRQLGFAANNLGVLCEDLERYADARKIYACVRAIDPENISALFNQFEMVRRGHFQQDKDLVEKELKSFLAALKHKYPLWSLSRYFGYVRSPELFASLGHSWAISGQPGAAMAGVTKAIELLPKGQKTFALQALASIYAISNEKIKSAAVYRQMLQSDPKNQTALISLTRLALTDGKFDEAQKWLTLAQENRADAKTGTFGVEWAVLHFISGDRTKARIALQQAVDLQPRNLQAWALLVLIQLQQGEVNDVAQITLPKMQAIAGTDDNYFVQLSKAQLNITLLEQFKSEAFGKIPLAELQKRALRYLKPAREAYLRAHYLRPSAKGLMDTVLQLDIAMVDRDNANRHARQVLRVNRKHPLANYVLGSLFLQEGAYGEAEEFLRRAVADEKKATAEACNDLAEVLRRVQKLPEAEHFARLATEKDPKQHVGFETLAAILLARNKLDEADAAITKSRSINSEDPRALITLSAIALRKGDLDRARMALNQARAKRSELSAYEQEELRKLAEQIR